MDIKKFIPIYLREKYWKLQDLRVINVNELYKYWEEENLRKVLQHYHIDCIFDIGANVGQYATMLRNRVRYEGFIISFEPIPEAASKLKEISREDSKWIVQEKALSNLDGKQIFNVMSGSQFSSISEPKHDDINIFRKKNTIKKSITVESETLVTAYNRLKKEYSFSRPFLKMDTQGYDVEIAKAGEPVIKNFIGLQSELAIKKLYSSSVEFREAIEIYESLGFELSSFIPNNRGHFPRLIETDCIMLRSDLMSL